MTLSDAATASRIVVSPLFFVAFFLPRWTDFPESTAIYVLWGLFAIIEASDLVDGAIARRLSQISDTGKLLDPFADSLSRLTYFFCFTSIGLMPVWIFLILLYRDLGVGYIRLLVLRRNVVQSARLSGKLKAWIYAIAGVAGIVAITGNAFGLESAVTARTISRVTFYFAGAVALWSIIDYLSVIAKRRGERSPI